MKRKKLNQQQMKDFTALAEKTAKQIKELGAPDFPKILPLVRPPPIRVKDTRKQRAKDDFALMKDLACVLAYSTGFFVLGFAVALMQRGSP